METIEVLGSFFGDFDGFSQRRLFSMPQVHSICRQASSASVSLSCVKECAVQQVLG